MVAKYRTPEEAEKAKKVTDSHDFLVRVNEAKRDPRVSGHADLISGLFEKSEWRFICAEHQLARFSTEDELFNHFEKVTHSKKFQPSFG